MPLVNPYPALENLYTLVYINRHTIHQQKIWFSVKKQQNTRS